MSFKDFCNKQDNCFSDIKKQDSISGKKEDVQDLLNKYSSFSQEDLMREFLSEGEKAKNNGLYSDDNIEKMKQTLFPFLNEEQKSKFENLMRVIKND